MAARVPGCCKTKKQYFKVNDQHFAATVFSLNVKLFHVINWANYPVHLSLQAFNIAHIAINSHGPPYRYKTPAYLLNCTYRV